jgi:hypothetical protein
MTRATREFTHRTGGGILKRTASAIRFSPGGGQPSEMGDLERSLTPDATATSRR